MYPKFARPYFSFRRKVAIWLTLLLCMSATSSACVGAILEVNDNVRASSFNTTRVAPNLVNYWETNGISLTNGLYQWNTSSCWMTAGLATLDDVWLAFELTNAKDIQALAIWNLTQTDTGGIGRDTKSMDMYFLNDTQIGGLGSFDSYFDTFTPANLTQFTSAGTINLKSQVIDWNTTGGQLINLQTPANDAKWVVFTNFEGYDPWDSYNNANYVGLGKVMFLDEFQPKADPGVLPARAAAHSSLNNNPPGGDRNVSNLTHETGGPYFRPLPDGNFTSSYRYSTTSSWLSDAGASDNECWLAFALDEPMELKGINFWNYAQNTTPGIDDEWRRGVKGFEIYTVTQTQVEALMSALEWPTSDPLDFFDSFFFDFYNDPFSEVKRALEEELGELEIRKDGELPGGGGLGFSDVSYVGLSAPVEDVAWVLMYAVDSYGYSGHHVGMGHVRFVANVPEPGTWMLMTLGLAGLGISCVRRRTKR